MLEQRERPLARAAVEARLQRPDLLHRRGEAARDRELVGLLVEHVVHRREQRRRRAIAARFARLPRREHLVPEQRGEEERRRHRAFLADAEIGLREREAHELLAEGLLEDHVEQRQDAVVQPFGAQPLHAVRGVPGEEQLQHLVEHPRRRHVVDQLRHLADRGARLGLDLEVELRREPDRAQHPDRVLAEAHQRIADDAHAALAQIGHAVVPVEHRLGGRVVVQRVHREVAPRGVLLARAVDVVAQDAPGLLVHLAGRRGAEGGHLDHLVLEHRVHELEAPPDEPRAAHVLVDVLGEGVGRDVEVLRLHAEHEVAHRAADHVGLVPVAREHLAHLAGAVADRVAADAVLGGGIDLGLVARADAQDAADEALDQRVGTKRGAADAAAGASRQP